MRAEKKLADIVDAYRELLGRVDQWFGRCLSAAGDAIACRSGCSECCRGLFDITLLDAFFLKEGFYRLPAEVREGVLQKVGDQLRSMQEKWPDYRQPYILNVRPEEDWEELMPDDDETPCPLLGEDRRCLVYDHRPMTCRLHGLPLVDMSGEVLHDEWCTLNFIDADPLQRTDLRGEFDQLFREEVELFRRFAAVFFKGSLSELDTFIPTALLMDFRNFDWEKWEAGVTIIENDPA